MFGRRVLTRSYIVRKREVNARETIASYKIASTDLPDRVVYEIRAISVYEMVRGAFMGRLSFRNIQ